MFLELPAMVFVLNHTIVQGETDPNFVSWVMHPIAGDTHPATRKMSL